MTSDMDLPEREREAVDGNRGEVGLPWSARFEFDAGGWRRYRARMTDLSDHLLLLAEPVRVRILAVLQGEELSVGELTRVLELPQSTASRHLGALRKGGWVHRRTDGRSALFRVQTELPAGCSALWDVVGVAFRATAMQGDDQQRLASVLAARVVDSGSFFERVAGRWDALRRDLFGDELLTPTLLALLPPGLVVVDLGCGTGASLVALAPHVRLVVGIDREATMLSIASQRVAELDNVTLHRAELVDLPLQAASVDRALAMLVLHHVEDVRSVFREMARVLRPGGCAVVLDMIAHGREDYARTMGHRHLGFSRLTLEEHACEAGLRVTGYQDLAADPAASGPPLFLARVEHIHPSG
jgi:SAM-dependent methyltransferase